MNSDLYFSEKENLNLLRITMVQTDIFWKDKKKNISFLQDILKPVKGLTDLIILPEMFSTGFVTTDPGYLSETIEGETIQWMKSLAVDCTCSVAGSLIIKSEGHLFNRLVYVDKNGKKGFYDKRHLFGISNEALHFSRGKIRPVFQIGKWRICFLICYDLRFPVWSRNVNDYDLLVYVANWPSERNETWDTLLRARAIENQTYVAGINRIGIYFQQGQIGSRIYAHYACCVFTLIIKHN